MKLRIFWVIDCGGGGAEGGRACLGHSATLDIPQKQFTDSNRFSQNKLNNIYFLIIIIM